MSFEVKGFGPPEFHRKGAGVCASFSPACTQLYLCLCIHYICMCSILSSHAVQKTGLNKPRTGLNVAFVHSSKMQQAAADMNRCPPNHFLYFLCPSFPTSSLLMFNCSRDYGDKKRGKTQLQKKHLCYYGDTAINCCLTTSEWSAPCVILFLQWCFVSKNSGIIMVEVVHG